MFARSLPKLRPTRPSTLPGLPAFGFMAFAALALIGAGCHRRQGRARLTTPIGIVTTLSGPRAQIGRAHERGYAIAIEEINANGGALGKPVELDTYDDQGKADVAAQGVDKLVGTDGMPVVIGSASDDDTLALVTATTRKQVPLVVPTATGDAIVEQGSSWVFRLCAGNVDYANALVEVFKTNGNPSTLALVYEASDVGRSQSASMKNVALVRGMSVVAEVPYVAGTPSYRPMLLELQRKQPAVVFFVSDLSDAVKMMRDSREIYFQAPYFASADTGFGTFEFPTPAGAGADAEFALVASQWSPKGKWPGLEEFRETFRAKYGTHPGLESLEAYVALKVVVAAIDRAQKLDPEAIRDALKALRMNTAFGPISFGPNGQNRHPVVVRQVQGGKDTPVWPPDLATGTALQMAPWTDRQ